MPSKTFWTVPKTNWRRAGKLSRPGAQLHGQKRPLPRAHPPPSRLQFPHPNECHCRFPGSRSRVPGRGVHPPQGQHPLNCLNYLKLNFRRIRCPLAKSPAPSEGLRHPPGQRSRRPRASRKPRPRPVEPNRPPRRLSHRPVRPLRVAHGNRPIRGLSALPVPQGTRPPTLGPLGQRPITAKCGASLWTEC